MKNLRFKRKRKGRILNRRLIIQEKLPKILMINDDNRFILINIFFHLKEMQLNNIVFPAPVCSYTTEKLFKDLVYIPRTKITKGEAEAIPCIYLPYENESKTLLFFHGNAEDIGIAFDIL